MKKIKLVLAAVIFAGLALTSCSSSDDGGGTSASIVGKWTPTKTIIKINGQTAFDEAYADNEAGCDKDYLEFTAAGALNDVVYFHNVDNACEADAATPGTYTKTGNSVTVSGTADYDDTYTIAKLTTSELRVTTTTTAQGLTQVTTIYFTKV
ncbi:MAG: lipocalin family protein [Flavobacterium sp.]|nr:lipocalin family protein [Flavobacterium sp.]